VNFQEIRLLVHYSRNKAISILTVYGGDMRYRFIETKYPYWGNGCTELDEDCGISFYA